MDDNPVIYYTNSNLLELLLFSNYMDSINVEIVMQIQLIPRELVILQLWIVRLLALQMSKNSKLEPPYGSDVVGS